MIYQPNVNPHCDKINLERSEDREILHQPDALPSHFIKQLVYKTLSVSYGFWGCLAKKVHNRVVGLLILKLIRNDDVI